MYTMVLMMAMTGPAETPSFGWRGSCSGCTGCSGCVGAPAGCRGGCTGSCTGWGAPRPLFGGLFANLFRGGCGGCGYQPIATCHGCGSCHGWYSHGHVHYGFAGCYGSCFGSHTNYFSYWQHPAHGYNAPMNAAEPPAAKPKVDPKAPAAKPKVGAAPAKVIIAVPENAVLFANGHKTSQTTTSRTFRTPELDPSSRYHYVFTAEAMIDGQKIQLERIVEVHAGGEIHVDFTTEFASKKVETKVATTK